MVQRQMNRLLSRALAETGMNTRSIHYYPINRQSPTSYKRKHPQGWTGFHSPAIVNQHRNVA